MNAPQDEAGSGLMAQRVRDRLGLFSALGVVCIYFLMVLSIWGQWVSIALLSGTFTFVFVFSIVLELWNSERETRPPRLEVLRLSLEMGAMLIYGKLTSWAVPVWLYLPLNALWSDHSTELRWMRGLLLGQAVVVTAVAVMQGCSILVPLSFILLSLLAQSLLGMRLLLLRHVMDRLSHRHGELARAHADLDRAHERAREQDRLSSLGMLAAGIAHEINNPLSYVKSNVNALYRDLKVRQGQIAPELGEYVDEVLPATLDGIHRIASIVTDLRRFARGEPEPMVEYDLNAEVQVALRMTQGRLHAHCDLEVDLAPELPRMQGRPRQIVQVVINLIVNAAQAMPGHGKIRVSTRQEDGEVLLSVRDTGMGMSPETLSRIFQPFFTTKPLGEGTGMGLAVVHGIVSAHGGRIQVESEPLKGSDFIIRLPRGVPASS
ncbi:ATP-binding protein [Stigmatella sp. ncwal1]|uniref:histidine kinase n=1 Tax=Stigmatella ashevillensis TaxID=2995309 RepID=A0ABT5DK71_9BACT|nr:ATP-binding protein [Stigmatella ashevillena]MDC0713931.1 ATP-binding protein [Stigmatella ashevillena]